MRRLIACMIASILIWASSVNAEFMAELPEPGQSIADVPLDTDVAKARDAGLAAAKRGDWSAAIAEFKDAHERAHCAPSLMYNLGLAHSKAGNRVNAALWYRAYLTAEPDAPNGATLRDEIIRFGNETEAAAQRAFDEAERLAEALSTTPSQPGGKTLRQKALEAIAAYAFKSGDIKRGDRLLERIKSLPNASPLEDPDWLNKLRSRRGLFPAVFARDLDRAKLILGYPDVNIPAHVKAGYIARLFVERGDAKQAQKWIEPLDFDELNNLPNYYVFDDGLFRLRNPEALKLLSDIHKRLMSGAKNRFNPEYFSYAVRAIEAAFAEGEEKVARDLAKEARAYYERFDIDGKLVGKGGELHYILILAVLGDSKAIDRYVELNSFQIRVGRFWTGEALFSRIALTAVRTMPAREAINTIDLLASQWNRFTDPKLSVEAMEKQFPAAYFARYVAEVRMDMAKARDVLLSGKQNSEPGSFRLEDEYQRALAFAVSTKNVPLALNLAGHITKSDVVLHYLYRLRALTGPNDDLNREIAELETAFCQGWRPFDADHAHEVRWRLDHASSIDPAEFRDVPEGFEVTARDKPETLPELLAEHATVLTMGANAVRVGLEQIRVTTTYEYNGDEVKLPPSRVFDLAGSVESADYGFDVIEDRRIPIVHITLSKNGVERLKQFSARNIGQLCGFIYKSKLVSLAMVRDEVSNRIQITGLTDEEAKSLAKDLVP